MKKVIIDSRKGVVLVNGKNIPRLLLRIIRGAVGKSFVVKHYRGGRMVVTRYPDMSRIVASEQQRVRRDLFREAVVYARWVIGDEERKQAFRKTLPRKKRGKVYQAAIQLYMRMQGDKQWLRKQLAVKAVVQVQKTERIVAGIYREWFARKGCQGSWRELWTNRKHMRWQGLEKLQGLPDCMADLVESDFDVGGICLNSHYIR
jgi:hypothetical protein